jgi:excisionase family DNA binding protein
MNLPASTRLATVRRALLSASALRGPSPATAGTGSVAVAQLTAADASCTAVAPALTAEGRELFVRPVPTMPGTDPKEHTMSSNTSSSNTSTVRDPLTLTVEETGRLLGISRGAAYRAAACGQIPTIRLGRRLLVPTARLHQLLGLSDHHNSGVDPAEGETAVGAGR